MKDNIIEAEYNLTKKSRLLRFYESNKILIYFFAGLVIISLITFNFYLEYKESKKIEISDNYVKGRIHLANGEKDKALEVLKEVIFSNDSTYSTLSLFLLINKELIKDHQELDKLFEHLIKNNKFDEEIKNLLIYKKILSKSNFADESEFLMEIQPLINSESLWKPQALLLAGDFFMSKNENKKAQEFYVEILTIKNLEKHLYEQATSKLAYITNE